MPTGILRYDRLDPGIQAGRIDVPMRLKVGGGRRPARAGDGGGPLPVGPAVRRQLRRGFGDGRLHV